MPYIKPEHKPSLQQINYDIYKALRKIAKKFLKPDLSKEQLRELADGLQEITYAVMVMHAVHDIEADWKVEHSRSSYRTKPS